MELRVVLTLYDDNVNLFFEGYFKNGYREGKEFNVDIESVMYRGYYWNDKGK